MTTTDLLNQTCDEDRWTEDSRKALECAEAFKPLAMMGKSDPDKLLALAQSLAEFPRPDMATDEGRDVLRMVRDRLLKLAGEIVEKAGTL